MTISSPEITTISSLEVTPSAELTVPPPEITISPPEFTTSPEVTLSSPELTIPPPEVTISTPEITIPSPEVTKMFTTPEYAETETIYDVEYGKDYKESYDEEEYEEETTEIISPIWQDYVEENATTESIIHVAVTITSKESTITSATGTPTALTETLEPVSRVSLTVHTETTMESVSTVSWTAEITKFEVETGNVTSTLKEGVTTFTYTLPSTTEFTTEHLPFDYFETEESTLEVSLSSTEMENRTTKMEDRTKMMTHEVISTTYKVPMTTDETQKRTRHQELKIELLKKLEELEKTKEELLTKEEELEAEEENWEHEKARRLNETMERRLKLKSSTPASVTRPTRPETTVRTTIITTPDMLEQEVRSLEKKLDDQEKDLKTREERLEERRRRLQKEKEEFEEKLRQMESEETRSTPSLTQPPPVETTFDIRETTKREGSSRSDLHVEEEEEEDYDTTKLCFNVLKKPLGKYSEHVVTERVCLPNKMGGSIEQRIKINGLNLEGHEWTESPHGRKSVRDRVKRGYPEDIDCEVNEGDPEQTRVNEVIAMYDNFSYTFVNEYVTQSLRNEEDRYRKRSILGADESSEDSEWNDCEAKNVDEENVLQWPTESTISMEEYFVTRKFEICIGNDYGEHEGSHVVKRSQDLIDDDESVEAVSEYENVLDTLDTLADEDVTRNIKTTSRASEDDDEDEDSKTTRVKVKKKPGPEWPTEAFTAYHIGGTKTWTLEFPEIVLEKPEQKETTEEDSEKDNPTTCYLVLVNGKETIETAKENYVDKIPEKDFESSLKKYVAENDDEYLRNR
ncbi:uncharacterized protein LOC143265413 [Megachile rotundata]|uniref:uncharacterized protein LOC143265413 n=1 Tax=Megachile rotundata TaxID=143995 RepID=UPI003FD54333